MIKHSENKIITRTGLFENKIGPEALHSRAQQTRALEEYQMHKLSATDMCRFCLGCVKFLQIVCLLNAGMEHSRSSLVSKYVIILFSGCSIGNELRMRRKTLSDHFEPFSF